MSTSTNTSPHSAVAANLGYLYQIYFALTLLYDAKRDDAFVSIETCDDVVLEDGNQKSLFQLKYSTKSDSKISIKSTSLWKTLRIWTKYYKENDTTDGVFILVTVATVDPSNSLSVLSDTTAVRLQLVSDLIEEAQRVISERNQKLVDGMKKKDLPYKDRYIGCQAFLDLSENEQKDLVSKISHYTGSWDISECEKKVIDLLRHYPVNIRKSLSKRVIEWWGQRSVESFLYENAQAINASELKEFTAGICAQLFEEGFVDDISEVDTPATLPLSGVLKDQLDIINATNSQVERSLRTEWRARYQRNKWIEDDPSYYHKIDSYSEHLIEEWKDQWYLMKENIDTSVPDESNNKDKGRKLLDWSHFDAPQFVRPIRHSWTNPDLVRGTYQILANSLKIGWHPLYEDLIDDGEK